MMNLEGVTNGERNAALAQIRKSVHAVGGAINSHERYSNAAANLTFEIDGDRIAEFLDLLAAAGVRVAEGIGEYGLSGRVRCGLHVRFDEPVADSYLDGDDVN